MTNWFSSHFSKLKKVILLARLWSGCEITKFPQLISTALDCTISCLHYIQFQWSIAEKCYQTLKITISRVLANSFQLLKTHFSLSLLLVISTRLFRDCMHLFCFHAARDREHYVQGANIIFIKYYYFTRALNKNHREPEAH